MDNNDAYMTISHIHYNSNIIILRKGILLDNIKYYTYEVDGSGLFIIFEEDIKVHKDQLRHLNII
jgi:hypothetical protein